MTIVTSSSYSKYHDNPFFESGFMNNFGEAYQLYVI